VARVALITGALSDVILSSPAVVGAASQAQRSRLQASVQAALYATATSTLDVARGAPPDPAVRTINKIADETELAARIPPRARASTLERLTVTRLTPDTADGAVQLWAGVVERVFSNPQLVTGVALQDAAATLAVVSHVAAETLREAAHRRIIDPDQARHAADLAGEASTRWRAVATWPSEIQRGGRAYEHHDAVRAVRDALTGPPLARLPLRQRVRTLRVVLTTAAPIGERQAETVATLASRGGLWIAHERPNLRPPGVQRRHVKLDWETMDAFHPAGRLLASQANAAQQALVAAADAINQAVLPEASRGSDSRIALVDDHITVGRWETIDPAPRARPTECDRRPAARPGLDVRP